MSLLTGINLAEVGMLGLKKSEGRGGSSSPPNNPFVFHPSGHSGLCKAARCMQRALVQAGNSQLRALFFHLKLQRIAPEQLTWINCSKTDVFFYPVGSFKAKSP